jgi:hypothetical protein
MKPMAGGICGGNGGPTATRLRHIRNRLAICSLSAGKRLFSLGSIFIGPGWGRVACPPLSHGKVTSNRLRLHRQAGRSRWQA